MKKIVAILLACLLFSALAEAKIVVNVSNYDGSVMYRSYKKVDKGTYVVEYALLKTINSKGEEHYYVKVWRGIRSEMTHLFADTATLNIDGKSYTLNRHVINAGPFLQFNRFITEVYYDIPVDIAQGFNQAKNVTITLTEVKDGKVQKFEVTPENVSEFKHMLALKFMDFDHDDVVNPPKQE